jgi:hypothetical protein
MNAIMIWPQLAHYFIFYKEHVMLKFEMVAQQLGGINSKENKKRFSI